MTTYTSPRNARVIEIDPEGRIVSVHHSEHGPTRALNVTRLRSDVVDTQRLSFGVLSPSGEQPLIGIDPDATAVVDELQRRFLQFAAGDAHVGRHRVRRPGLVARLFGPGGAR